jgi:YVTN family beta-propeller protein
VDRGSGRHAAAPPARPAAAAPARAPAPAPAPAAELVERRLPPLAEPVAGAAAAPFAAGMLVAGGLTSGAVSTDAVRLVRAGRDGHVARLPQALHDAAAVALGGSVYLFGGGDGVAQLDGILRVAGGRVERAGSLPAGASDVAAAVVGGTAYVVGGYTGRAWLDTIVAWRPGGPARVVAHLPGALRYAAAAAAGGRLVIAGGSTPSGAASAAVLSFDPRTRRLRRLGRLPAPTTHAAAASVGGVVYVIGGRGAARGTPTAAIVAVDPRAGTVRPAGHLLAPRSDLVAVARGPHVLVAGGLGPSGTTAAVGELVPARRVAAVRNVYAAGAAGRLSGAARSARPLVYVPNSQSDTVDVVDQRTMKVIAHYAVGALPQHVVPSWDLRTLYVTNDAGNTLTPLDPRTGRPKGPAIPVDDPYNLYFTPDGRSAIVVAERLGRLDFRDPRSFRLQRSLPVPCRGVDHMDFSADGRTLLASCEFSGQLVAVNLARRQVVKVLRLRAGAMPQDVKLAPDGRVYYVADMASNGVWLAGARSLRVLGFLATGRGAHGLYPSRDARLLYVTNRGEGSISLIDFATRKLVGRWQIGGSPDMGGVSADGRVLWLSGRYDGELYAISTRDGHLLARIRVGNGPHGVCVWPQPGRYSLGHTGILR